LNSADAAEAASGLASLKPSNGAEFSPAFASYSSADAQAAIREYIRILTNPDDVAEVVNRLPPGTPQY